MPVAPPEPSRRPHLIFVHLSPQHSQSVQKLIAAIKSSEALQTIALYLILSPETEVSVKTSELPANISTHTCQNQGDDTYVASIQEHLTPNLGMTGIMVNSKDEQEIAVAARRKSAQPIFLWRTWHAMEELQNSRSNKQFYNVETAVNCYMTREIYRQFREPRPNKFSLANPYILEQESLTENGLQLMLEHGLLSLFFSSRNHPVSGHKCSHTHIKLTYVTHFYCNQKTTDSIMQLLSKYASYSSEVLDHIQFVIVDDGSPMEYEIPDLPLNLTWLKVKQDIRWNQAGARNLGVLYAKSDNVIATDLDHEFPEVTFAKLLKLKSVGKRLYKFWRKNPEDGSWHKGHPNIFMFSRGRFFELFGYDEEFAGGYGAEDFRFVKFQKDQGTIHKHLPKKYFCIERQDIDRKRSYHSLNRDLSFNTPVDARKNLEFEYYGHGYGHSRSTFNFEHKVLLQQWREAPVPPIDRNWKRRYLLRQLLPRGW